MPGWLLFFLMFTLFHHALWPFDTRAQGAVAFNIGKLTRNVTNNPRFSPGPPSSSWTIPLLLVLLTKFPFFPGTAKLNGV
jgi:hypothetical protein